MKVALLGNYPRWALEGRAGYHADPQLHPAPWVQNLSLALAQLGGIELHVVTQTDEVERDMDAEEGGVRVHYVRCPRRLRSATFFQFDRLRLRRVLHRIAPDVVNMHGTEDAYSLAGLTAGYPCVLTMQGMIFRIAERLRLGWSARTWVLTTLERWCLKRARHVIAKSNYLAESIRPLAPRARMHFVPNAMSPIFFNTPRQTEPDLLVFAGIITHVKGLEHLIAALHQLRRRRPAVRLAIAGVPGRGSRAYFQSLQERVRNLGMGGCVEYLGFQRPAGLAQAMARACAVVVPSLEEMFCNVAAEAMAVGCPVIASRAGSLPQLVGDGETGLLVPVANPDALAAAMERLLADDALRARLGEAAKAKALRLWDPLAVARQTAAVYEAVLSDPGNDTG
jgi:glycosyltransferase involved in cell wall biosynthesis